MAAGVGIQQEVIVRAALTLLDEVGLEGLTMRRLATALKIQAPSLYWHFPNKQALLDGMADAIFGAVALPRDLKGKTWDVRLKAVFRAIRRAFLAHRDGARVFAGTYVPDRQRAPNCRSHDGANAGSWRFARAFIRRSLQPRLLRAGFHDGGTGTGSANRRPARSREPASGVREPCGNEVPKHPRGFAPYVRQRS